MAVEIEVDLTHEVFETLEVFAENNKMTVEQAAAAFIKDQLEQSGYLDD